MIVSASLKNLVVTLVSLISVDVTSHLFGQIIAKTEDDRIVVLFTNGTYKFGDKVKTDNGKEVILFTDGTYFFQTPKTLDTVVEAHLTVGEVEWQNYIAKNLKYPRRCKDEGINGSVVLQCMINETGQIRILKIIEETKSCPEFTEESKRVIYSTSGKWVPKKINGEFVDSWKDIPIRFTVE